MKVTMLGFPFVSDTTENRPMAVIFRIRSVVVQLAWIRGRAGKGRPAGGRGARGEGIESGDCQEMRAGFFLRLLIDSTVRGQVLTLCWRFTGRRLALIRCWWWLSFGGASQPTTDGGLNSALQWHRSCRTSLLQSDADAAVPTANATKSPPEQLPLLLPPPPWPSTVAILLLLLLLLLIIAAEQGEGQQQQRRKNPAAPARSAPPVDGRTREAISGVSKINK